MKNSAHYQRRIIESRLARRLNLLNYCLEQNRNMPLLKVMLVEVLTFLLLSVSQGVDALIKCHSCNWEAEAQCVNRTTQCVVESCLVAKALVDGKVVYRKTCLGSEDCNNVVKICGRPDPKRTCLAGACCDGELCIPAQLTSLALPSSSVKTSSAEVQTSSATQIIMMSSDIFATAAVAQSSSKETTQVPESTAGTTTSMAATSMTTTTTTRSFKEIITKATEASMKGMMGTPTIKMNSMLISEGLLHSRVPAITRPTCKDSSGMHHVLSPLAIVFVAARLMALLF